MTRCVAPDGATLKMLLTALVKPEALAVSWLFAPAASIRRFVKLPVPLPAAAPMSKLALPCNGPVPLVRPTFTFRLAGKPTVEVFPNES